MRFVRKNGRVIPIRESGAPASSKKKYPPIKKPSTGAIALGGTVGGIIGAHLFKMSPLGIGLSAGAGVLAVSSTIGTKSAKGESSKHTAQRISNYANSRKYR